MENEVKDEAKREDGDPALKQRRREIGFEFSKGGLDGSIRDSSVVIVNPHEYAIALSWNPSSGQAPVCMAKGVDQVARSIRKLAANHGVPIYRNPPLARSLCAELRVGDCVEPEHYRAVAAAIRYAEMLRTRRHKSAFPT